MPGLGPLTVSRILKQRAEGRIRRLGDIGRVGVRLRKAGSYLIF